MKQKEKQNEMSKRIEREEISGQVGKMADANNTGQDMDDNHSQEGDLQDYNRKQAKKMSEKHDQRKQKRKPS
jgi:hypothetical protein